MKDELTDKQVEDFLPQLGYFMAQSNYYGRKHICQERDGFRALAVCGQVADGSTEPRKNSNLCGRCKHLITPRIRGAIRDQIKLARWVKPQAGRR
jgi:hypothetical protein